MTLKDINTDLIFNKLTEKGICKFIGLYDIDGEKSCDKNKLKKLVTTSMGEGSLFELIPLEKFIKFYRDTEEAGQKHFYFYKFDISESIIEQINDFKTKCINENDREFKTALEDEWFYHENDDEITFKLINIKEVYQHDKTLDTPVQDGKFFRGYIVKTIQNVLFFRFNKKKNLVLIGIDKYSDLDTPSDIRNKIKDNFELICGENSSGLLEDFLNTDIVENLLAVPNAISTNIKNEINNHKKSAMFAKNVDILKILTDIDQGLYAIDQVKVKNPDFDIKTHPTYQAEQSKKYQDDIQIDINNTQIYWFTHFYKRADYFRMKISTVDSSITTYSSSITKEEFEDVILQII